MALPKIFRIKKGDFGKIFYSGETVQNSFFFIRWLKTDQKLSRFAVVISSKVSAKAIVRNKIRRRAQAVLRNSIPKVKTGFDIIILARPKVKDQNFIQLEDSLMELLKKANLF